MKNLRSEKIDSRRKVIFQGFKIIPQLPQKIIKIVAPHRFSLRLSNKRKIVEIGRREVL